MFKALLTGCFLFCSCVYAEIYHHSFDASDWEQETPAPFDELLISWNAERPAVGAYSLYVSVKVEDWSPWQLYATWGASSQKGYITTNDGCPVRVYQDAVEVLEGKKGQAFRVRVVAEEGASLDNFKMLHVCASDMASVAPKPFVKEVGDVDLSVAGLSQMALSDERRERLCSPTSTTAVVRYLQQSNALDPIQFAESVWDAGFDIFGNWVFNAAGAYAALGKEHSCWVERLSGFEEIYDSLKEGMPVVISVRSPLPGSAKTYKSGHLIVVKGYDSEKEEVLCMDPAFSADGETLAAYALDDLMAAWSRRQCIAYRFQK